METDLNYVAVSSEVKNGPHSHRRWTVSQLIMHLWRGAIVMSSVIVNWCWAVFDAGSVIFCLGVVAADMTQSLAQPLCAKYLVNDDYQNDRKTIHCWVWKHRCTCRQTEFSACFRFSCRFNLRGVGGGLWWFTEDCSLMITAVNLLQPGSAANIPNASRLTHSISSSFNLLPLFFFLLFFYILKKNK